MSCKGCKYNRDFALEDVLFCIGCKRAYKKNTEQYKVFKDRYEKNKIIHRDVNLI